MKTRKVGTLTLGAVLVVFGILFLLNTLRLPISYQLIMKLWPSIFIFLGMEVLVSYFRDREGKITYDGGAIAIMILLTLFSIGMAFVEWFFRYAEIYGMRL